MALAYELNLQSLKALTGSESEALDQVIFNHASVPAKVILDSRNRVIRTILDPKSLSNEQNLILKIRTITINLCTQLLEVSYLPKA